MIGTGIVLLEQKDLFIDDKKQITYSHFIYDDETQEIDFTASVLMPRIVGEMVL